MPLPRPPAHLKREITEKEWAEARRRASGRTSQEEAQDVGKPEAQRHGCGQLQRLASRYYRIKAGHCLSGKYLQWTENRPTTQCWWCPCQMQTREQPFKVCPEWKGQRKILWAEVLKETRRRKRRFAVRDLLADGRCGQAVLDFLPTTDVGRLVPTEEDAENGWGCREREEERSKHHCFSPRPPSWRPQTMRSRGRARLSLVLSFVLSFRTRTHL